MTNLRSGARLRGLRILVILYVTTLQALPIVLLVEPDALLRARKFWLHDPSLSPRYQGMVRAHTAICAGMPERSVVFLGDSRVLDLPVGETVDAPAINLGIGGDTIRGLRSRVDRYPRLATARRLVVGVGVNDLSHFPDDVVIGEYRQLLARLTAAGPKITAVAIYPIDERRYTQANSALATGQRVSNARIRAVNERIREECRLLGVDFVDANEALAGEDGNLRPELSDDGYHLNVAGARVWGTALRPRFAQLARAE